MSRRRAGAAVATAPANSPGEKSRAALLRELSAAVRASQGGTRATWRPGRAPDWWPKDISFSAPAGLTATELRDAVRASETAGAMAAPVKVERKACLVDEGAGLPPARAGDPPDEDDDKEDINGREDEPDSSSAPDSPGDKSRAVLMRELKAAVRASQGGARAAWRPGRAPDWWPQDILFSAPTALTVTELRDAVRASETGGAIAPPVKLEEKARLVKEEAALRPALSGTSVYSDDNKENINERGSTCDNEVNERSEHTMATNERILSKAPVQDNTGGASSDVSPSLETKQPRVSSARDENTESNALVTAVPLFDAMPPPPPKPMRNRHEAKRPHIDVEELEQTIRAAIAELELGVAQRKERLKAMLRLKCDDVRATVQLTLQKLPKRVREMPVKDYVLEFGGDAHNFMIRALEDRVFAQLVSTAHETPEKAAISPASTDTGKPDSEFRTAASNAARTARKRAAPATQAPPYALRRSARTRGGGATASTARAARGMQSALFASTRGIVKATPARPARGGEKILLFSADGSPLSPGAAGRVVLESTPGSGDDVNEDILLERLAAAEAEVARVKKIEKLIRRRLLNASRKK